MALIRSAFLLLLFTQATYSQAYPPAGPERELKFNAGLFLATGTAEASYEYYFGRDMSLGGTLYWDNDPEDYNGNFGIGPNLRAYFGFQPRSGFFVEGFGLYFRGEDRNVLSDPERLRPYNSFALGLGAGNKWSTPSGRFTLELHGGIGRNLNSEIFQSDFIYRAGLNIGVRF